MSQSKRRCFIVAFVAAFLLLSGVDAQTITIKGDRELGEPLITKLIDGYANAGHVADFRTEFRDSTFAFKSLIGNRTQIGISTREIRASEKEALRNLNLELDVNTAALDYMVVIANTRNPVDELTLRQLEAAFSGGASDWSRLGGERLPVKVFTPNQDSQRYALFQQQALNGKSYATGAKAHANDAGLVRKLRFTPGGLGFVGMSHADARGIKPITVEGIAPEAANVAQYPLSRPVYFYSVRQRSSKVTTAFIQWVAASPVAAQIIVAAGLVPPEMKR